MIGTLKREAERDFDKFVKDYKRLEEENRLLKNEITWLKDHTKYNYLKDELYIDGTMTATEAKLRLQQAESNQNYVSNLEEENKKLKESLDIATKCSSKEEDGIIRLSEENNKLKLHIEAKDKAYTALLKDYEELKEDNKRLRAEIEEWLNAIRKSLEK